MKLSTKGRYAVMAMVDLASHSKGSPVALADIAGQPMIAHVARRAIEANVGEVVVATDAGAIATAFKLLHVALALAVLVFARRAPAYGTDERHAARLYWAVVAVVLAWSIVPLTVEKEFFAGTNTRGRMCLPFGTR